MGVEIKVTKRGKPKPPTVGSAEQVQYSVTRKAQPMTREQQIQYLKTLRAKIEDFGPNTSTKAFRETVNQFVDFAEEMGLKTLTQIQELIT